MIDPLDTAARLASIGIPAGVGLDDDQVRQVLAAMTDSAQEATGSSDIARTLLAAADFDGSGLTAEQLVRDGRSARVLSRIDDLRFGARG